MFNLANISFLAPWALSTLLLLPLIWRILKVTPPKPTTIPFPAVRLLQELSTHQVLATKTPWWILLIRSLIAICLILAMAQPVLNANQPLQNISKPYVIIIDNDWSVTDNWSERQNELNIILNQLEYSSAPILIAPTADNIKLHFTNLETGRAQAETIKPRPWPTNRKRTLQKITNAITQLDTTPNILWISNNLMENERDNFLAELHQIGDVEFITGDTERLPLVISSVNRTNYGLKVTLNHLPVTIEKKLDLNLIDEQANILFQQKVTLVRDTAETVTKLDIPAELRSQNTEIHIGGSSSPASQFLLDERWRDRPVGIISTQQQDKALLAPAYYIRKSLGPHALVREDTLGNLMERKFAVLINTGQSRLNPTFSAKIENWISTGGIYVNFASLDASNQKRSNLSPVRLMQSQRIFGGTLSWKRPAKLSPFPEHSPFNGLTISDDIIIKKQILARPESNLSQKTWARLEDGTPLITAKQIGTGWSVLFHVTPIPNWSNLPLSGTFEMMMIRLLSLSTGNELSQGNRLLNPYRIFDHNGHLVPAPNNVKPITTKDIKTNIPSEDNPPGLYGHQSALQAFNLGPTQTHMKTFSDIPLGVTERSFSQKKETLLAPWALLVALCFALLDWLLTLTWLRVGKSIAASFIAGFLLCATQAHAEPNWDKALAAANQMRLAYMVTGDSKMDETSRRGLKGLGVILRRRTAVELSSPMAFNPEKDDPSLFPMIYWPINDHQSTLSVEAAEKLSLFLKTGGFILFDTMGKDNPAVLSRLSEQLEIGPLQPVSNDHILTRSFYLLHSFPGRYANDTIWVEAAENSERDRVSSILVGSNAWTQAWAKDDNLKPLYAVVPDGEVQREYAYRFGVNLVMYILSGNYKGDQVHLPAIMQRLGL